MIDQLEKSYAPVTNAQCASVITDLLGFYWETALNEQAALRQQAIWFGVLSNHSFKTIQKAAFLWLKGETKKPTPAHILAICDDIDSTSSQIEQLKKLLELKVFGPQPDQEAQEEEIMQGDLMVLANIIREAKRRHIAYTEDQQTEYLQTGKVPDWYYSDVKA